MNISTEIKILDQLIPKLHEVASLFDSLRSEMVNGGAKAPRKRSNPIEEDKRLSLLEILNSVKGEKLNDYHKKFVPDLIDKLEHKEQLFPKQIAVIEKLANLYLS